MQVKEFQIIIELDISKYEVREQLIHANEIITNNSIVILCSRVRSLGKNDEYINT